MKQTISGTLRRFLAMVLCVAMLASLLAVPVGAAEPGEQDETISVTAKTDEQDETISDTAEAEEDADSTEATETEVSAVEEETVEFATVESDTPKILAAAPSEIKPIASAAENTRIYLFDYGPGINTPQSDMGFLPFYQLYPLYGPTVDGKANHDYYNTPMPGADQTPPKLKRTLTPDNPYPTIIGLKDNARLPEEGSLQYLFDPTYLGHTPKDEYLANIRSDVEFGADGEPVYEYTSAYLPVKNENGEGTGLFQNIDGYLVYDSALNAAWYNPDTQKFELYDYLVRPGHQNYSSSNPNLNGNFLPFNKGHEEGIVDYQTQLSKIYNKETGEVLWDDVDSTKPDGVTKDCYRLKTTDRTNAVNLNFGMVVEFDFYMPEGGQMNGKDMVFDFYGDDDVWVFIDDVLVLDIGGGHGAVSGTINFADGTVTNPVKNNAGYYGYEEYRDTDSNGDSIGETDLFTMFKDAGADTTEFTGSTFTKYTKHTLKFFYMERGGNISYCRLKFNMPTLPDNSLTVGKELTVTGDGSAEDKIAVENSLSYQFRVWQSDAEGKVSNVLFIKPGTTYDILEGSNKVGTGTVDKDGCFSLKAGQQAQFADMLTKGEGIIYYVVEEILPGDLAGQYGEVEYLVDQTVHGTVKPEGGSAEDFSSIQTGSVSAEDSQIVVFKNKVNIENLGTLKVRKEAATGSAFDMDKEFQIQVKLGGVLLPVGTEYKVGNNTRMVNTPGILELRIDETAELDKMILSGTEYEITELIGENDQYQATYTGTVTPANTYELTASGTGVTGKFPLGGTVEVIVTNENFDFSGLIPITKTTVGNTGAASFQFAVDQVTAGNDGSWTVTTPNVSSAAITVAGDTAATANAVIAYDNSTKDTTFYYKVYELDGNGPYDYDDTFYIVEVYVGYNEAEIRYIWKNGNKEEAVEAVSFVNQKLTSVIVTKNVLGIQTEEAFGFKATINGVATEFTLVDDGTYEIPNIPVGAHVTVEETQAHGYFAHYRIGSGAYAAGNQAEFNASEAQTYVTFVNTSYVADDTVVIDYGLPVDIHVLANDALPDDVAISIDVTTGGYGNVTITNNVVRYTPTTMAMNDADVFTYKVTYAPAQTGIEHVYSGTLTVIPATTIYYEDSFVEFRTWDYVMDDEGNYVRVGNQVQYNETTSNWTWVDTPDSDAIQAEDRPGEGLSEIDADNLYGYDQAYTECAQYSLGSARKTTVNANTFATAEFTFYGTGFDVISLTSSDTGTITVKVYDADVFESAEDGYTAATVKSTMVDTYYGYTYNAETNEWTVDNSATNNALYQIPVMKIQDLPYDRYHVVITASYSSYFDHNKDDASYDFYLDAIRIYDPANDGENNEVIKEAYVADGEGWPSYYELRNKLINAQIYESLVGEDEVSGIIFIDGKDEVDVNNAISDYANYGPNNELYLAHGQAVAFNLNVAADTSDVASIQLAMKSVGVNASVKVYDAATGQPNEATALNTATDLYYEITDLEDKAVVICNAGDEGEGIVSITNIKVTYNTDPAAQESGTTTETTSVFTVSRSLGAVALASLNVDEETTEPETPTEEPTETPTEAPTEEPTEAPTETPTEPEEEETFEPKQLKVTLNSSSVKVGDNVKVTVTTKTDVEKVVVNGQAVTEYWESRLTGTRTWSTFVTAEEAGELIIAVSAVNAEGISSVAVEKTVTVTVAEEHKTVIDLVKDLFEELIGGLIGGLIGRP